MGRSLSILCGFCLAILAAQPVCAQQAAQPAPAPLQAASYGLDPLGPSTSPDDRYGLKPLPPIALPVMPRQSVAPVPQNAQPARIYAAPGAGLQPDYRSAANRPGNAGGSGSAAYRLGPGDKVRVSVFGEDDLSGEYQVDGTGLLHLPLVGATRAGGLTAQALGQAIAAALTPGYLKNPRVNVDITAYRPFYIIGAVNRPGEYAYVDNMNVLNAVALAGGFTDKAVQSIVYVRHEDSADEQSVPVDQLAHVRPGDVIRVKTTLFWDAMDMLAPIAEPAALAAASIN